MYLVFMRLERSEEEKAEITCYMEKEQLQDMKKKAQKGVASYEYANMTWNIKEMYVTRTTKTDNELEQNPTEDIKRAFEMLAGCCTSAITTLQELAEQNKVVIEEAKEIAILEQRKKHCKNYMELKQINRRLNLLKFKQRRRK